MELAVLMSCMGTLATTTTPIRASASDRHSACENLLQQDGDANKSEHPDSMKSVHADELQGRAVSDGEDNHPVALCTLCKQRFVVFCLVDILYITRDYKHFLLMEVVRQIRGLLSHIKMSESPPPPPSLLLLPPPLLFEHEFPHSLF